MPARALALALLVLGACAGGRGASSPPAGPGGPAGGGTAAHPLRVVDGDAPGGFPYRVWVPAGADPARPPRLAIWLHPSTAGFVSQAGELAPGLAARGFALLAVTGKNWAGWTGAEAQRLLDATVPYAALHAGVDRRRPLLVGFSAGGQMALLLWRQAPAAFRGAAVTGAEPVTFGPGGSSREMEPPAPGGPAPSPLFVLEGAEEPGARMWRGVAADWRAAGVRLELRIAAGRGHEWMLGEGDDREAFLRWVETLDRGP
jgi:predicted esterase